MVHCWLVGLALLILLLLASGTALAWGYTGHTYHAKLVRQVLPLEMQRQITAEDWAHFERFYVHYPDWGFNSEATRLTPFWEYFRQELKRREIGNTHDGIVRYFALLTECFRRGETREALVWAGCITHLLGDAYACNHWPLSQAAIYQYGSWLDFGFRDPGMKIRDLCGPLELNAHRGRPVGRAIRNLLAGYEPKLRGKDLNEAAIGLYAEFFSACFSVEGLDVPLLEAVEQIAADSAPQRANGLRAANIMAQVGAACTRSAADFIFTAFVLARRDTGQVDVAAVESEGQTKASLLQASRTLSDTPAYAGLLSDPSGPAVGLIACTLRGPGWYGAGMGFGSMWFNAAVLRYLRLRGIPTRAFQADRPRSWDLDPEHTPVMIAGDVQAFPGFSASAAHKALASYWARGGKILYLGGPAPPYLNVPSSQVEKTSGQYPLDAARMKDARVTVTSHLGAHEYVFRLDMTGNTYDGGAILRAPWRFREGLSGGVEPLVQMSAGGNTVIVGAGEIDPTGKLRTAVVPLFLLYPGALNEARTLESIAHPVLDRQGGQLLIDLLRALDSPGTIVSLRECIPPVHESSPHFSERACETAG